MSLIQASLTELTRAATTQAAATLTTTWREVAMTSPTHEEEFLTHLTQAGLITARVLETMRGTAPGAPDAALLRHGRVPARDTLRRTPARDPRHAAVGQVRAGSCPDRVRGGDHRRRGRGL